MGDISEREVKGLYPDFLPGSQGGATYLRQGVGRVTHLRGS